MREAAAFDLDGTLAGIDVYEAGGQMEIDLVLERAKGVPLFQWDNSRIKKRRELENKYASLPRAQREKNILRDMRLSGEIYAKLIQAAIDIAEQLKSLWDRYQLLHLDIKPANIFYDPNGRSRAIDFGLAKRPAEWQDILQQGLTAGTPLYMSPLVVRGRYDQTADICAFGRMLRDLL